jgi:hypothetical protein
MTYIFEAATTKYDDDKLLFRKSMGKLQNLCKISDGYLLEEPVSKFGWTFFQMMMKTHFHLAIEEEFSDMIKKSKGGKPQEKFTDFLLKYLEKNDCKIKLKLVEFN